MSPVHLNPDFHPAPGAPAVFADRDGTLLKHVDYLGDPARVELLPGVGEAVRRLLAAGAAFFLFTNQSGVGRGYYTLEDVHRCHARMFELMRVEPEAIAGWCIAPGLPDSDDPYRKPSPRFIHEALGHFSLDPARAHMIGDTEVDLQTARNAGVHAWLVANGKPQAVQAHQAGRLDYGYTFRPGFTDCIDAVLGGPELET